MTWSLQNLFALMTLCGLAAALSLCPIPVSVITLMLLMFPAKLFIPSHIIRPMIGGGILGFIVLLLLYLIWVQLCDLIFSQPPAFRDQIVQALFAVGTIAGSTAVYWINQNSTKRMQEFEKRNSRKCSYCGRINSKSTLICPRCEERCDPTNS